MSSRAVIIASLILLAPLCSWAGDASGGAADPGVQAEEQGAEATVESVIEAEGAAPAELPTVGDYQGVVTRVIDGDQVEIDGKPYHLLGVDAPEVDFEGNPWDCYSAESRAFVEGMILNKPVTYSFDRVVGRDPRRGIKRIYLFCDGGMVNAKIIAGGRAFADRKMKYAYRDEFRQFEDGASFEGLGLWHSCPVETDRRNVSDTKVWKMKRKR
jgi:endonuclease YncB( thermonuclease family)